MTEAAAAPPVIEVHDLYKRFGRTAALRGLDLVVQAGEVHGFLGPDDRGSWAGAHPLVSGARGAASPDAAAGVPALRQRAVTV